MTILKRFTDFLKIDFGSGRIYGLDILRAVSIFFVVFLHSLYLLPRSAQRVLELFDLDGVLLFFVLSGFLIGGILIRILEKDKANLSNLTSFWRRRWLRTLPAYYFVLLLLILLPVHYTQFAGWGRTWDYFLFLQNINTPQPYFFSEAWSLSIEEWFYISVPAIIFLLVGIMRLPVRAAVAGTAVAVILLTLVYRYYVYSHITIISMKQWDNLLRKEVLTRLDSIMMGVTGAYAAYYHKGLWSRHKVILLTTGLVTLLSMKVLMELKSTSMMMFFCVPYLTVNSAGVLLLLPFLSELKTGKGAVYQAVTFFSIISYSMYLLNFSFIQGFVLRHIDFYDYSFVFLAARYILFWTVTILGAVVLYKCIERPFIALRDK